MTIGMQKLTLWMISLALLSACDAMERDGPLRARLAEATFTTTSYNYTPYGLYSIAFKASGRPFNIDEAASGGSVLLRDASLATLDTGDKIPFTSGNCCIIWDRPLDQPLRVKVVWNVVIDPDYYDGKSSVDYDERTSTESAPGTRWCEAVIDIAPSKDAARPDAVVLDFFQGWQRAGAAGVGQIVRAAFGTRGCGACGQSARGPVLQTINPQPLVWHTAQSAPGMKRDFIGDSRIGPAPTGLTIALIMRGRAKAIGLAVLAEIA